MVVNQIHNQFAVNASGTVINTDNASSSVVLDAKDDAFSLGVAVGVAGGKGKFNAAGSVVVSNVDQGASVVVNDLTSTVNRLNVHGRQWGNNGQCRRQLQVLMSATEQIGLSGFCCGS